MSSFADSQECEVVYGIHAVEELINNRPEHIERVLFQNDTKANSTLFDLIKRCRKQRRPYQMVPAARLDELCGIRGGHQGVVAQCPVKAYMPLEELQEKLSAVRASGKAPLLLLAASVEDPRNLGAIIRSCVGFGVDGLLLEQKNTAPLSGTVAKSAAGMLEHIAIVRPRNLEGVVQQLRSDGWSIIGAEAGAPSVINQVDMAGPTLIITGGEHRGIPPYLRKQCTALTAIPLTSQTPSLNVSVAAAVMLYECARQRNFSFELPAC